MSLISTWSTTAASNNSAAPDGWPEGMSPSDVNNAAREMMAAIRTQHENKGWADLGHTVTYLSATTFKIATDVTAQYSANRRIQCTDSGTLYGIVVSSSYGAPDTTVTVALDSGSLSVALSAVALGAELNASATSIGIDDNATGQRVQIFDTALSLGTAGASYVIQTESSDQLLTISGGSHSADGANLLLYGGTHANTGDFLFRNDSNVWMQWDESAGAVDMRTGIGSKTVALTISSSQDAAFAGEVDAASLGATIMDQIYPVGSIYTNKSDATNPQTLLGFTSTWVAIEDAFLIGASATYAAESTGGNKDAIIPNHTHPIAVDTDESGPITVIVAGSGPASGSLPTNNPTGGASVTNANLPPYVAVYMWVRTA